MKCRDMVELATDYMENSLAPRARLAARVHLWLCVSCRRYLAQLRRTVRFLGDAPSPPPPANEAEILARLTSDRPRGRYDERRP